MSKLTFQENVSLSSYSTFRIGGPARFFTKVTSQDQMREALFYAKQHAIPWFILGKGSNILFDDKGFGGLVILNKIENLRQQECLFWVGSGYSLPRLALACCRLGYGGLEFAVGIPASVGGAIYMNAGTSQAEISRCVKEVLFLHESGEIESFEKNFLHFSYRHSSFHLKKGVIIEACLELTLSKAAQDIQRHMMNYRKKTQPLQAWSAGCVFKNPSPHSAGALIDKLGLKGTKIGEAMVSLEHANFVINTGSARSADVLNLISKIQEQVKVKENIQLEMEISYVPYLPS